MFYLAQLRRTSFIALLAMLMLAFAPTISKVIASEKNTSNWVEVCTTDGGRWLSAAEMGLPSVHEQTPSEIHDHGGECSYCNLQVTKFLASSNQSYTATNVVSLIPSLFYLAPKPLFAWTHSRSRAPPSFVS